MTKLNKTQKILRWAAEKKTRPIGHAMTELNSPSEKAFMFLLNRLKRFGFITFTRTGQSIELHLTQAAYYNRKSLVV